ncbi:non-ribosomal peptide synthetase [Aliivibrio fischeri]|uniref:Non-ribosomal peptide synthetase n=1 Tax=Aliivibrio fischeri TaxID=668 RepID=A0A510ULY5_ALIFS|nr:non-ribosomal peptide synthetase [Aliivibrio fischeri]GEK15647.1 non-ribosomal peptide synthetase [Aliivibrio fischeri]
MSLQLPNKPSIEQTKALLFEQVSAALGRDINGINTDADLVSLGLNSVQIMTLVGQLRKHKIKVKFAELIKQPTLSTWLQLAPFQQAESHVSKEATEAEINTEQALTLDPNAPFDLAPMQHAYWVGRDPQQYLGGVAAHFYHEFDGIGTSINPTKLEVAVRALMARHGMLRVQILDDGQQRIPAEVQWSGLTVHNLSSLTDDKVATALEQIRAHLSHRQLRIEQGEVFDVQLTLTPTGSRLHINLDMVAADAFSLRVLLTDLAHLYLKLDHQLPQLNYSFPEYQAARKQRQHSPERLQQKAIAQAYWQSRTDELPGSPVLPMAIGNSDKDMNKVVRRHCQLSAQDKDLLSQQAAVHGLTLPMVLAATLAEVLTVFSENDDFLLNLPLFNREPINDQVQHLVGDFTSSILLSWRGSLDNSFVERTKRLQQSFRQDVAHSSYAGIEVLRDLSRKQGKTVYAPVVFTSALGLGELFSKTVRNAFGDVNWIISQGPQVWLDVQVMELDEGISINWDAREAAFAPGVLDDMFGLFGKLLTKLTKSESQWHTSLNSLLSVQQLQAREKVNSTSNTQPTKLLHNGFFQQALANPNQTAAIYQERSISYDELATGALKLASYLAQQGIKNGDLVAISLPKGPEQIIAVMAVLTIGAAYLPLGIDQPALRRDAILAQSQVRFIIDNTAVADECPKYEINNKIDPQQLAYVIFTSGSTGTPKGVEITHAAAWNTISDINHKYQVNADDRVLAVSALDFDLSVYDLFGLLSVGGALVLIDEHERRDAERWHQLVRSHKVSIWNTVPALLDMLLTLDNNTQLTDLRLILTSGDWVGLDLPDRLHQVSADCRFIVLGGATEASIWSNYFEVSHVDAAWRSIPYGYPLAEQKFRVVDKRSRDCPDWVAGELWIGGSGVAKGYCGQPELSAQKFVQHNDETWYRTGDLGRYWPNACLEFLGRDDNQVKIRGHRIELSEIESALLSHRLINQAAALVTSRGIVALVTLTNTEDSQIIASQTAENLTLMELSAVSGTLQDLPNYLQQRLTGAMLPAELGCLASFPLTANGKVDRQVLQHLANKTAVVKSNASEQALTPIEQKITQVWAEFLAVDNIQRDSNFFTLGGDSLLATRIVRHLREQGFSGVNLAAMFSAKDLADFASGIELNAVSASSTLTTVDWQEDKANRYLPFPPTEVQKAYWLGRDPEFILGGIGCHFYREYQVEDLDIARLEQTINRLIQRHEMLRAVFDDAGQQRILSDVPHFNIDLTEVNDSAELAYKQLRDDCAQQVFDPSRWPLFDVRAVRCGNSTRIAFGLDNLILDAFSIIMFYRELNQLYLQPELALDDIQLSFRDYVTQVLPNTESIFDTDEVAEQLVAAKQYWQNKLPELPPAPQLPLACAPESITQPKFVRLQQHIEQGDWQKLEAQATQYGITSSSLLLTAFSEVLSVWSQRPDLSLNLTLFDRREVHQDIYKVMGDFTSLTLIGYQPQAQDNWLSRLQQVQQEVGQALEHRDISSVDLMRELARRNPTGDTGMPVVFTSALGIPGGTSADQQGPLQQPIWALTQTPQVWLDHQVVEVNGGVLLNWDLVDGLFPADMCEQMFDAYIQLLTWAMTADWQHKPPHLLPTKQRQLRAKVNCTTDKKYAQNLAAEFFQCAKTTPDLTALKWQGENSLTYAELADKALRVANWLQTQGVTEGELVAVNLTKGPEQIAAVLGVLAAGAAYLPIGVDQPQARQQIILNRAKVTKVLTADNLPLCLQVSPLSEPNLSTADQLAYVIFTSGSTGEPKGVAISHQAAWNTIAEINEKFSVTQQDTVLALSALDFDLSVYDIFGLLSVGGCLVLIDEGARRDAEYWQQLINQHQITIWNTVPALLDMLLTFSDSQDLSCLRVVLNSGDWIGLDLPHRLQQASPNCQFIALGGATETAIWSNSFTVEQVEPNWPSIPYGYPLRNQAFRVIDSQGRDCPDWVPGELWIGGDSVALGYFGDPELTAERFVQDQGKTWYRTGDMGRYWANACLEFLGRQDNQVKLRGHRIELGEIEVRLTNHGQIQQAVALIHQQQLVAAFVTASSHSDAFDKSELHQYLSSYLPSYMVPECLLNIESIPLTANGKVDRKAIVALANARASEQVHDKTAMALQTEEQKLVAALWQPLLNVNKITPEQSFFELGGDSLMATRFIEQLKQQGYQLALRRLFAAPMLADVANAMTALVQDDVEEGEI